MTYDPNNLRDPDLQTTPVKKRSWMNWIAVIALVAVAAVVWSMKDGGIDSRTTASTTNSQPALAPATPAQ